MEQIRNVRPGDEDSLAYVQTESWKAAFREIVPADILAECTALESTAAIYRRILDEGFGNGYLMELDGKPHCIAWWSAARDANMAGYAELICLHSLQENWRKGYGRAMMERVLADVKKAGYEPGKDFRIAMDAASSEWKSEKGKGYYKLPKAGTEYTAEELIEHWAKLCEKYPIISIEDALDEEDWEGWKELTAELGGKVQLVGDDLFVTNTERLAKGISLGCGNSILIKLNQIGSVSETLEAIKMAHKAGYTAISSHRSGETEDTTIADLAVALNTCQIKTGAPSRTERVAKYNQLLRIEEELGTAAVYPGARAFNVTHD